MYEFLKNSLNNLINKLFVLGAYLKNTVAPAISVFFTSSVNFVAKYWNIFSDKVATHPVTTNYIKPAFAALTANVKSLFERGLDLVKANPRTSAVIGAVVVIGVLIASIVVKLKKDRKAAADKIVADKLIADQAAEAKALENAAKLDATKVKNNTNRIVMLYKEVDKLHGSFLENKAASTSSRYLAPAQKIKADRALIIKKTIEQKVSEQQELMKLIPEDKAADLRQRYGIV